MAQVLCHKNHPRIRIFGFRLLLLWLNDLTTEYPEAIYLFSNAISLDLFMYDGEDLSIDNASSSQTRLPLMGTGSTGRRAAKQVSQYFETAYVNVDQELLQCEDGLGALQQIQCRESCRSTPATNENNLIILS